MPALFVVVVVVVVVDDDDDDDDIDVDTVIGIGTEFCVAVDESSTIIGVCVIRGVASVEAGVSMQRGFIHRRPSFSRRSV